MPISRIDVLAVGHAPVLQINRKLYRILVQLGWRLEIAMPRRLPWSGDLDAIEPDHADDPPIHRLEPRGSHVRFWSFTGLSALLDRKRPRIVYLENGPDSLMAWAIGGWCRRNDAVLISNTYENDILSFGEILRERRVGAALRSVRSHLWGHIARDRVNYVVAICDDGRNAMELIGFKGAVSVTPLGFDPALFFPDSARRAATRKALGLSDPVIAYFGRLTRNKGVHVLIAALAGIKNQFWQLLLDDFGHDSTEYVGRIGQAINETGIHDRVIRFAAPHEAIPDYMRAADIVVVPSIVKEQYGRVVAEAMACGCALIVSEIGALPELVGNAGLKVPPGNAHALRLAIADLLESPKGRADLASRAESRAHVELSVERQAALLDSLFRRMTRKDPEYSKRAS
jgi:glycosyltransferase involved in cell wall biosynthesis